jgi:hypothetical protein
LLDKLVYIIYGSHLEDTSLVDTLCPFPGHPANILRYSPECVEGVFCEVHIQDAA